VDLALTRGTEHLVSQVDDRAAYGGTPSDETVVAAIQDLKARGLSVTLTPFIFMDIPAGNALPDPYTGVSGQPSYPWRGRITVSPAPGEPGRPPPSPPPIRSPATPTSAAGATARSRPSGASARAGSPASSAPWPQPTPSLPSPSILSNRRSS
jgi:hypothetical protein